MNRRLLTSLVLWVGLAAGCPFSFTNEDHCAARDGDATCAAADPSTPYCALDGCGLYDEVTHRTGCVAEQPSDMSCYSPCGGKQDANARSDCEESMGSSTVDGTGTETTTSTSVDGRSESSTAGGCGCDPATPICRDGECVACPDDPWCAIEFEGERDVCLAGDCVVCAPSMVELDRRHHRGCSLEMPNCSDEVCVSPCLLPDDCPETSCEHRYGVCGPLDRVLYVSPDGSDWYYGTMEWPLQTIAAAIERISPKASGDAYTPTTIFLLPGTYEEAVEFAGRTVIIRPTDPDTATVLRSPDTRPVFNLLNADDTTGEQAVLNVVGLRFEGSMGPVARVGPTARFLADGVEMVDNAAGIEVVRGQAFLRNSIVVGTSGPVLLATDTGDFGVVASTIIENTAQTWFDCSGTGEGTIVTIRDSIVGTFGGTPFEDLISTECALRDDDAVVTEPRRTVTGGDVESSAFRIEDGYRLELNPGDIYQFDDEDAPAFCAEGSAPQPSAQPCPPRRDIDGKVRLGASGNWKGASVP